MVSGGPPIGLNVIEVAHIDHLLHRSCQLTIITLLALIVWQLNFNGMTFM